MSRCVTCNRVFPQGLPFLSGQRCRDCIVEGQSASKTIQQLRSELEAYQRGFIGDEEELTIKAGGVVRHVTCLQCHASTEITLSEDLQITAGEMGRELIEALNQEQDESEWRNGCCPEHAHLGDQDARDDHFATHES